MNKLAPLIIATGLLSACSHDRRPGTADSDGSTYTDVIDFDAPNPGSPNDAGTDTNDSHTDILVDAANDIRDALLDTGVSLNDTRTDTRDIRSDAQDIRADLGTIGRDASTADTRVDTGVDVRDASSESCRETVSSSIRNAVDAALVPLSLDYNYMAGNNSGTFVFPPGYTRLPDMLFTDDIDSNNGTIAVIAFNPLVSPALATTCFANVYNRDYSNEICFTFSITGRLPIDFRSSDNVLQAIQVTEFTALGSSRLSQIDLNYNLATILQNCSTLDFSGVELTNICPEPCEAESVPLYNEARRLFGLNTSYTP